MPKNIAIIILLLGVSITTFAQQKKANQTYQELGYKAAIPLFENKDDLSTEDLIKIANAYRLNHDVTNAELWYSQVVQKSQEAIHLLHYAQALHSNGKYELAKEYYRQYQAKMGGNGPDQRGANLAEAIENIQNFKHTDILIKNESAINTGKLEFSPTYYQNGIVFVSTLDPKKRKKKGKLKEENEEVDLWINDNFMTLYFAEKNEENELENVEVFSGNLSTKYHEGPVTFDKSGERIFFSRNQYLKGKKRTDKKGIMKMNIYSAIKSGNDWQNVKEMPWNTQEYEEVHPTLTANGNRLYFASNREGGQGGMDLYYSDFQGGEWSEPVNLGNKINTAGNEIFPFVHEDGTLYFASDGWGGFGGLDIFAVEKNNENSWTEPTNIGTPFNSPKDDFGFILNITGTEGYLSSARDGGNGKDDIYSFNMKDKNQLGKQLIKANICVYDQRTNKRIEGVEIFIKKTEKGVDENVEDDFTMRLVETEIDNEYLLKLTKDLDQLSNEELQKVTNSNGEVTVDLDPNTAYLFIAKKNGYQIAQYPLQTKVTRVQQRLDFCIPLTKSACMTLQGKAVNSKYESLIPNAKVTLVNLCTGEEETTISDANGNYEFTCLPCRCEFLLIGEKPYFKTANAETNTLGDNCEIGGIINQNLLFNLGENEPATSNQQLVTNQQPATSNQQPIPLTVGNTIELKNIYYDFDKYYIREGSAESLDWVVRLMQKYPSLVLELTSHTDARGTTNYNNWLSRKRAKSAVKYITDRGISPFRLQAIGYGETQIRNECEDGVDCSEEDHQYNRRTEIRVLAFERKDVQVYYLDNEPEKIDYAPLNRQR
ncbi:MAG: OmpA family protein [Bacteroidota bacterium]